MGFSSTPPIVSIFGGTDGIIDGHKGLVPGPLVADSGKFLRADGTWASAGAGTVSSVGLSLPAEFTVSGSPVTTSGTLTGVWANKSANVVMAGPTSGGASTPGFRALVTADIPSSIQAGAVILAPASSTRNVIQPPTTDQTTGILQVNNQAGTTTVFNVDSTNKRVGVGIALATAVLDVRTNSASDGIWLQGNLASLYFADSAGTQTAQFRPITEPITNNEGLELRVPFVTGVNNPGGGWFTTRFNGSNNRHWWGDNGTNSLYQTGHDLFINTAVSPNAFYGPHVAIKQLTTSTAQVGINTGNPQASLDVIGVDALSTSFAAKFKSTSAELITNVVDRDFSGANNWTGTNWATTAAAFRHTAGSTADAVLANANLTASQIVISNVYKVVFTLVTPTAGTVTPKIGTAAGTAVGNATTYTQYIVAAANNANLIFTPTTDFDGALDNVSITRLKDTLVLQNDGEILHTPTAAVSWLAQGFGVTPINMQSKRSNGVNGAPTAIVLNDVLLFIGAGGYDGSVLTGTKQFIQTRAIENWSGSAQGTDIEFAVTGITTTSRNEIMRVTGDVTTPSTMRGAVNIGGFVATAGLGGQLNVAANTAAQIGVIVRGASSQSANLQEWQTSTPTTVLSVASAGHLTFGEAINVILGTTTGTKIGTVGGAAGQKLGFFNATPIVQPLLATGAGATVDNVITALQNLGLVRQS